MGRTGFKEGEGLALEPSLTLSESGGTVDSSNQIFPDTLFILQHEYEDGDGGHIKTIGIFSDEEKALEVMADLIGQPGFKEYPDGFYLGEIYIDEPEWLDGFGFDE